jgi:hypothetical protein
MSEEEVVKLTFTVLLTNGLECKHTYDAPSSADEMQKLMDTTFDMIYDSLSGIKPMFLSFFNPYTVYNPRNVLGVRIEPVTTEELKKAIRKAQRKAGLVKK